MLVMKPIHAIDTLFSANIVLMSDENKNYNDVRSSEKKNE